MAWEKSKQSKYRMERISLEEIEMEMGTLWYKTIRNLARQDFIEKTKREKLDLNVFQYVDMVTRFEYENTRMDA